MKCTVQHRYSATRSGSTVKQFGPWGAGDVVEVDEDDIDWVNADSPGALVPEGSKPAKKAAAPRKGKAEDEGGDDA